MKALSYIVASILMLIITITLSGTAYLYISGILTQTMQGIEVADAYCSLGEATISIRNIGSSSITKLDIEQTNPKDDPLTPSFQGTIEPGKTIQYKDLCTGSGGRSCIYRITPPAGKTVTATITCAEEMVLYITPVFINSLMNIADYSLQITLDTQTPISEGKMKSDCSNIRFIDSDNTTNLAYWVEAGCNSLQTKIWVKVPTIPTGQKTIYVYYSNLYTSQSNPNNVFLWYDDFSTNTRTSYDFIVNCPAGCGGYDPVKDTYNCWTQWTGQVPEWACRDTINYTYDIVNQILKEMAVGFEWVGNWYYLKSPTCENCAIRAKIKWIDDDGAGFIKEGVTQFGCDVQSLSCPGYVTAQNVWYTLKLGTYETNAYGFIGTDLINTWAIPKSNRRYSIYTASMWQTHFDDLILMKFVYPEPTVSI